MPHSSVELDTFGLLTMQTRAASLMRAPCTRPPPIATSKAEADSSEFALTPRQRMRARKLAEADARMQEMSLHVRTGQAERMVVHARKQLMISGSMGPTPHNAATTRSSAISDVQQNNRPKSAATPGARRSPGDPAHGPLDRPDGRRAFQSESGAQLCRPSRAADVAQVALDDAPSMMPSGRSVQSSPQAPRVLPVIKTHAFEQTLSIAQRRVHPLRTPLLLQRADTSVCAAGMMRSCLPPHQASQVHELLAAHRSACMTVTSGLRPMLNEYTRQARASVHNHPKTLSAASNGLTWHIRSLELAAQSLRMLQSLP